MINKIVCWVLLLFINTRNVNYKIIRMLPSIYYNLMWGMENQVLSFLVIHQSNELPLRDFYHL